MNINNLLQVLTEDRNIEHVNENLKDKVPQQVIDTLSSLMRKNKYDNIAMEIFSAFQEWDGEYDKKKLDFLRRRTKLVYYALKEAAKDNSHFDPAFDLRGFRHTTLDPMKFWADYRSGEKKGKEYEAQQKAEKKQAKEEAKKNFGLEDVRIKELRDCYLIFPKNWKFGLYQSGFRVNNLAKQEEGLRHLSMTLANRDTSGITGATDNHWCVAASEGEGNMYSSGRYKGDHKGGIFIVIVLKNPDGSPDWNERYLFWAPGPEKTYDGNLVNYENYEFADKMNRHYRLDDVLPPDTEKRLYDIIRSLSIPKGEADYEEMENQVKKAEDNESLRYNKKGEYRVSRDSALVKNYWKVLRYLRNKYKNLESAGNITDVITDAFRKVRKVAGQKYAINYKDKGYGVLIRPSLRASAKGENEASVYFIGVTRGNDSYGSDVAWSMTGSELDKVKADPESWTRYIPSAKLKLINGLNTDTSLRSKARYLKDTEPPKGIKDALRNNKAAIDIYASHRMLDNINSDEYREWFMGPNFLVSAGPNGNEVYFCNKPWDSSERNLEGISNLESSDVLDEVKRFFERKLEGKNAERS